MADLPDSSSDRFAARIVGGRADLPDSSSDRFAARIVGGRAAVFGRSTLHFFCAVVIVGLLAGFAGLLTTVLLRCVEHLTYHYTFGPLLDGITGSSPARRALGPMVGGMLAAAGWWMLRRRFRVPPLATTIGRHERIPRLSWSIDAALQVVLVGSGASLGREGAPRQFAVALSDFATGWLTRLSPRDREILLACAAGAGLGAVYAVPLAGALFAVRIMLNTWHPRALGAALITSSLAVAIGSAITHDRPELDWPSADSTYLLSAHGLALAPLALVVGMAFNRLMARARPARLMQSWVLLPALAAAGLLTGICSHWWPELPGNGKSILTVSLASGMTLSAAAVILLLKPMLTALYLPCWRSGRYAHTVLGHRGRGGIARGAGDQFDGMDSPGRADGFAGQRCWGTRDHARFTDLGRDLRLGARAAPDLAFCGLYRDLGRRVWAESAPKAICCSGFVG